jgi:hypothetical protein
MCRFSPYMQDAATLFAGLAPGLTGIYQVPFQMPAVPNPGKLNGGRCSFESQNGSGSLIWDIPVGSQNQIGTVNALR